MAVVSPRGTSAESRGKNGSSFLWSHGSLVLSLARAPEARYKGDSRSSLVNRTGWKSMQEKHEMFAYRATGSPSRRDHRNRKCSHYNVFSGDVLHMPSAEAQQLARAQRSRRKGRFTRARTTLALVCRASRLFEWATSSLRGAADEVAGARSSNLAMEASGRTCDSASRSCVTMGNLEDRPDASGYTPLPRVSRRRADRTTMSERSFPNEVLVDWEAAAKSASAAHEFPAILCRASDILPQVSSQPRHR